MSDATTHHHHHHRNSKNHSPKNQLREIEVPIISAENLKNVKHVTKMKPYAAVYVEKAHVAKTHVDDHGGTDPTWNEIVKVKFPEHLMTESDVTAALNVDIYAHGRVREKPVGSAKGFAVRRVEMRGARRAGGQSCTVHDGPGLEAFWLPRELLNLWVLPTGRFLISKKYSFPFNVNIDGLDEKKKEAMAVKTAVPSGGGGGDFN